MDLVFPFTFLLSY